MNFGVGHRGLCAAFAAILALTIGSPAFAAGVTRIQQSNGNVKVYNDVRMRLNGTTLWITSADRRGVLEIRNAACSYAGAIRRCLPFAISLRQHGSTHAISLHHGTVYVNLTNDFQHLPLSSRQLGPHGLLVVLRTQRGTFVSIKGTLDKVTP